VRTSQSNDNPQGPDLAFLLTQRPGAPSSQAIVNEAQRIGIWLQPEQSGKDSIITFRLGSGATVIVAAMDAPHPDVQFLLGGYTAPTRADALACASHAIVTAMGLTGTVLERDRQMAALTGCVVRAGSAVAAMLGHGASFHNGKVFADFAELGMKQGRISIEIAIDVTFARESGTHVSMLTHGMPRYGREDFLMTCRNEDRESIYFLYDLIRWMLYEPTKELPTGDTLGRTAAEKLRVQRQPSPIDPARTVIRLDMP
jgi:hypothetical protein